MRLAPAKLAAIVLVAIAVSGTGIAVASAQPSAPASHRGAEHFTLMFTSTRTGSISASVIATGLFTDGGTISLPAMGHSAGMKLGAGTIRLTTTAGGGGGRPNRATCLITLSSHGTYRLSRGTGKYVGIRGTGRFTAAERSVAHRKRNGSCAFNRTPLVVEGIANFSGPVTLRR
jgi:hypothetical protein